MMTYRNAMIVFKKELKDFFRDKRTIITTIIVPLLMFPLIYSVLGGQISSATEKLSSSITIGVPNSTSDETISLLSNNIFSGTGTTFSLKKVSDFKKAIDDEDIDVGMQLDDAKVFASIKASKPFELNIIYDSNKLVSGNAISVVQSAINRYNTKVADAKLKALGLSEQDIKPAQTNITTIDEYVVSIGGTATSTGDTNPFLAMMLPLLLGVMVPLSTIAAATDMFAGEKERGTLEPLLSTKAGRSSVLLGKYFAVIVLGIISITAYIAGFIIALAMNPSITSSFSSGEATGGILSGLSISLGVGLMVIVLILLLSMTSTAIQVALSTWSKSVKEAGSYMSFMSIAVMIPAYATMMLQPGDVKEYMMLIPLYNVIASMKLALGGIANIKLYAIAIASSLAFLAIILVVVLKMLKKESVLFRN